MTYSNGDIYKGQFLANKKHGNGTYLRRNGEKLVGVW